MMLLSKLINTLFDIYVMILLLRIWMQWSRCDFYNPLAQFVVKVTQPVIKQLRRIIPAVGSIDTASLLFAWVLTTLKYPILVFMVSGMVIWDPKLILIGFASLMKTSGYLVFWVIIIRSLMSWISQGRSPVEYVLIQLTEPLMAPIRRLLPAMGGIDFSAMVVVFILYMLNYFCMVMMPTLWFQI